MTAQRLIALPTLRFRAALESVNASARTVDVVWSTGAAVERRDGTGARYIEVLSLNREHVRMDRLNAGAPLLDGHQASSVLDVIGTVVHATVDGHRGTASVRFSQRESVQGVWTDVVDGILRAVSVGYVVWKYEEAPSKSGGLPVRTAVDWEPFELSLVAMPADVGARVRSDAGRAVTLCEVVPMTDAGRLARINALSDAARVQRLDAARAIQTELNRRPL